MSLSKLLARRPLLVALAGPNGAGKSTFQKHFLVSTGLQFVNADVLALAQKIDAYTAAAQADKIRNWLIELRETFVFETVFSDPVGEKVTFLQKAEAAGYTVLLIFIGLESAELSNQRVALRVAQGGHDVPEVKVMARFQRSLQNLKRSFSSLSNVLVYDHTDLEKGYVLVASRTDGREVEWKEPVPEWLLPLRQ